MSSAFKRACVHCGKTDLGEWDGYRSFWAQSCFYSSECKLLCEACASAVLAKNASENCVVPFTIDWDVRIVTKSGKLFIETYKSEQVVPLRLTRLAKTPVGERLSDMEYERWLRRQEDDTFVRDVVSFTAADVVESHLFDPGSQTSARQLCRYLTVKARNTAFEGTATAAAALIEAIGEVFQVTSPATVKACWTLVSALQESVYEVQEVAPQATEAKYNGSTMEAIDVSPLQLTSVAQENPLFFGAVLHTLFQEHTSVVATLLDSADAKVDVECPVKRDDIIKAISGLLVCGSHLTLVAAMRQRDRCLIEQVRFWSRVMHCSAIITKRVTLDALRQSWPVKLEAQRTFNVEAYMSGFQQHLGIFLSSFWAKQEVFNRSFDVKGQSKPSKLTVDATERAAAALDGDVLSNYMEGLRIANDYILYQPLCFVDGEAEAIAPSKVFLKGELWARIGCQQLLDTLNRFLFRDRTPVATEKAEGGDIVWTSAWQLAWCTVKQLCLTTFHDGSKKVSLGDVLEEVVKASEKSAEKPLLSSVNLDLGRNTARDAAVSKKLFELLHQRGEEFLKSSVFDQSADVRMVTFHLTNFLCGKSNAKESVKTNEVVRLCCGMHRRQRGASSSADFMSCSKCLLKVFFPDTPESELKQLGEVSYAALNLELKLQLRQVVGAVVTRLHSVEEHIHYVLQIAFTATSAEHFRRVAEGYLKIHLLPQSSALVQPYVERMYRKLATLSSVSRLVRSKDSGSVVRLLRKPHVKLSDVVADVQQCAVHPTHVMVVADFILDINCDLRLPGVSVSLTAYKMRLHGSHTIDVSGRNSVLTGRNGKRGVDGVRNNTHGGAGELGHSGVPGDDGGNISLLHELPLEAVVPAGKRAALTLLSSGGDGSRGGNGGAGGDGYSPPNMKDATLSMFSGKDDMGGRYSQFSIEPLMCPSTPGKAGKGGGLGGGGLGGRRGEICASLKNVGSHASVVVPSESVNGNDGAPGSVGPPGEVGKGGWDGRTLSLTRHTPWCWGSSKWVEEDSYYVLEKNGVYYDGKEVVRGRESSSTQSSWRYVDGSRKMYYNYTHYHYECIMTDYFVRKRFLGGRQYVNRGKICNRDDLKNQSSNLVSNPVAQTTQRLSFEAVQETLKDSAADFVAAQRAVTAMAELQVDSSALGALATEAHNEISLLDRLLSQSLGEAIVAMERTSSFTEALASLGRETVQTKAQVLREWKRSTDGCDEKSASDDDGEENEGHLTAVGASEKGFQVLEFYPAGPLYDLRTRLIAFNLTALSVRHGGSPLALYLQHLAALVKAIEGTFGHNTFVLNYTSRFYSRSLFQIEAELYRVSAEVLLTVCLPASGGDLHIPPRVAECAYRALTYRYVAKMANDIAAGAGDSGAMLVLERGWSLGKLRLCAERLRFCAPTQIGLLLSEADVRVPVCPLLGLSDTPDFCSQWSAVLELGKLLFFDACTVTCRSLWTAFERARKEFLGWILTSATSDTNARLFAHSIPRKVYDWLLSFAAVCEVKDLPDITAQAVGAAIRNVTKEIPSLPLFVLDTWKDVVPPMELLSHLLGSAAGVLPDESDATGPPSSQLLEALTSLLSFLRKNDAFASETAQSILLTLQFQGSQKLFVVLAVRVLKMRFLLQRIQKFCGPLKECRPVASCFCTLAKGERWGIREAVAAIVQKDGIKDLAAWYWRTPCWNCYQHLHKLIVESHEFLHDNIKDIVRLRATVEMGCTLSLASFL